MTSTCDDLLEAEQITEDTKRAALATADRPACHAEAGQSRPDDQPFRAHARRDRSPDPRASP